jgi:hypothetical protein
MALEKWITPAALKRTDYLFPGGDPSGSRPMSGRQLSRLLKFWVVEAGLDPTDYSVESLRRTKALHILTVSLLKCGLLCLGHGWRKWWRIEFPR